MDFSLTEEQTQIRDLARQILRDNCGDEFHMHFSKNIGTNVARYSRETWKLMADSGLLGTAVPEAEGGSGFGLIELCQILEEQGHTLAPVPLLPSLVYGGLTLARYGNALQQKKYLGALATGKSILTAAIAEESMALALRTECIASEQSGIWRINGLRIAVPYAKESAAILVSADVFGANDSVTKAIFLVQPDSEGVECEFTNSGNHEPFYSVTFANTPGELVGTVAQGKEILKYLINCGSIATCAIMIGLSEESMRRTAQFTSERKQFDTAIASFQNTTMKMADCYIDIEALRSSYYEAMWKLAENKPCDADVKVAKYWACGTGHRVTHICQHLHGGIGADMEYPLHRYYLWFKQMDLTLGGGTKQLADLGKLMAADNSINLLKNLA